MPIFMHLANFEGVIKASVMGFNGYANTQKTIFYHTDNAEQ